MDETPQKRILIVDDEEVVRSLCSRVLAPLGYAVETAPDANQALALTAQRQFELVITDFRMPGGLDGLALGQLIKERQPSTRIILMTAFPAVDNAVRMLRLGASNYLIKPFEKAELMECVQACFVEHRAS